MTSKNFLPVIITLSFSFYALGQDYLLPNDDTFWTLVPKNTKVEKVATGFKFTEGPVWNKKGNYLLFSDIPANNIVRVTPDGINEVFINPSENSNGITYDLKGRLIVCQHGARRVIRIESDGKSTVLADKFNGKKLNSPNDVIVKSDGTIFFTDPPYGLTDQKLKEQSFSGVYRLRDGVLTVIDTTLLRPNGIALSPDEKYLYVAQSEFNWLWKVYELDKKGNVLNDKIFFQGPEITGNPDGVKVDTKGNVYCTANNGVVIFTKEGKYLGTIKVPENTANLAWGDADLKTLYIAAQNSIYKIKLNTVGYLGF
jgi:gluconolactonase